MAKAQSLQKTVLGLVVLALAYGAKAAGCLPIEEGPSDASSPPIEVATESQPTPTPSKSPSPSTTAEKDTGGGLSAGLKRLEQAFLHNESDVIVEAEGIVERLLPDDNEGSRHQKFILRLDTGRTLLISHNIDLAPRVPAKKGDTLEFKGEYEWTDRGGVLHWTHHDPKGWHEDGWLRHNGKTYK